MKLTVETKRKLLRGYCILLCIFIGYTILINNPIIVYDCDKDVALEIISKEEIRSFAKSYSLESFFKIVKVRVFNPNHEHKRIDLELISTLPIINPIIEYSQYDVPGFRTNYGRN